MKTKKAKPKAKKAKKLEYEMVLNEQAPKVELYGDPGKWNSNAKFKKKVHAFKEFILGEGKRMLGLAANQTREIGGAVLMEPFIAIRNPDGGCNVYIDPQVTEYIGTAQIRQEFPLTQPKNCIVVERYNKVEATWFNPMGGKRTSVMLEGLLAQAFQHLTDQVNGFKYDLKPYGHIHSGKGNRKRNDPCACGSLAKTKRCCGVAD